MGIVARQSIKSIIVTLTGVVLGGAVTLLSARFFSKADYGFTQNLIKVTLALSTLGMFGFNMVLLVYGQKYPPGHPARGTFLTICCISPLVVSLLIAALLFILRTPFLSLYNAEDAAAMDRYFILFPLLTLFWVLLNWMEAYLQSEQKTALQSFAREVLFRVVYIVLIMLYAFNLISFGWFLWLFVIAYIIPFSFLLLTARKMNGFVFQFHRGVLSGSEIKDIIRFSGYHMLTFISSILISQLDSLLLAPLAKEGLEAVAVYSVAGLVIATVKSPTRVVSVATTPTFSQHYHTGRIKELRQLFVRSAVNLQIMGIGCFLLIWLNLENIQTIMSLVKEGYEGIKSIILILMVGQLVHMLTGFNNEMISVSKYYRFNFWSAIAFMVVVFLLNYLMITRFGIIGAAWATSSVIIIFNLAKCLYLWIKLRMTPFSKKTLLAIGAGMVAGGAAWLIPALSNVFLDAGLRSLAFVLVFWLLTYKSHVSREFDELTRNILRDKKLY